MRRIAVINQKGGVGKTTTATNLGAALAHLGRRVVVIDVDAQGNLSLHLDAEAEPGKPSTYMVLAGTCTLAQALRPTRTEGLSIVPANLDLSGAELELASAIGRERLLREAIDTWEEEGRKAGGRAPADYVILDCPPSLGLLSINALAAVREVLITLQTEFFALQGMSKLVDVVQLLRKRLNPELVITGILPCLYDSRLRLAREVLAEIRSYFPGQVFEQPIRTNVKLAESPSFARTIFEYAPDSNGARDYLRVALEVVRQEVRDPDLARLAPPPGEDEVLKRLAQASASAARAEAATERAPDPVAGPVAEPVAEPVARPAATPAPADEPPVSGRPATRRAPTAPAAPRDEDLADVVLAPQPPPAPRPEPARTAPAARPDAAAPTPPHPASGEPRAERPPDDPAPPTAPSPPAGRRVVRAADLPPLPPDAFETLTDYVRHPY